MDATAVERTEEAPVQENWITHSSYLPPLTCNIKQWQLGAKELFFILGQKNPLTEDYFNFFFSFFSKRRGKTKTKWPETRRNSTQKEFQGKPHSLSPHTRAKDKRTDRNEGGRRNKSATKMIVSTR